jgi:hypothetical protein
MKTAARVLIMIALGITVHSRDITVQRNQIWNRLTVQPQFNNGFGALLSGGFRENRNVEIAREENDPVQGKNQGVWLREYWIGPTWNKATGPSTRYVQQLLYRPQFWYTDLQGGTPYLRHTFQNNHNLFISLSPAWRIHQRATLWGMAATENFSNELIFRYLAGPQFHPLKKLSLGVKVEPFFKLTAHEDDDDGTEFFHKLALWNTLTVYPVKGLGVSLEYVYIQSHPESSRRIDDHYLSVHTNFSFTYRN